MSSWVLRNPFGVFEPALHKIYLQHCYGFCSDLFGPVIVVPYSFNVFILQLVLLTLMGQILYSKKRFRYVCYFTLFWASLSYHFRSCLCRVTGSLPCSGMLPGMSLFRILAGHQDLGNSEHLTGNKPAITCHCSVL